MKRSAGRSSGRPQRIASVMQRELASIIARELGPPATEATVSGVDVAPDLSHARFYVTHRAGADEASRSVAALNRAAPLLRRRLAARLSLRIMPELRFVYDASLDRGSAIEALLRRIETEESGGK
ncbi:MAG: 30S ribosome-binding factor RbfA [Acidiferrobacteraceae bacterium]